MNAALAGCSAAWARRGGAVLVPAGVNAGVRWAGPDFPCGRPVAGDPAQDRLVRLPQFAFA